MLHKNRTLWMIVTVMMIAGLLAACGAPAAPADTAAAPAEGMAEEMEMADDAALTLAAELEEASGACYIEPAPASFYAFDDMSNHYQIVWLASDPYGLGEVDGADKSWVNAHINQEMNIDFQYHLAKNPFQQLNLMLAAGDIVDTWGYGMSWPEKVKLVDDGVAIDDLTPYIKKFMPNYVTHMSRYGGFEAAHKRALYNGKIIAFVKPPGGLYNPHGIFIRQDWLENLGLEMPTTTDELKEIVIAFAQNDPDGNGEDDTYGMIFRGIDKDRRPLGNLSGLGGLWTAPDGFAIYDDKLVLGNVMPGRKEFLAWAKEMADVNGLPPDWYTIDATRYFDRQHKGDIGVWVDDMWTFWTAKMGFRIDDYELFEPAHYLEGPTGESRRRSPRLPRANIQIGTHLLEDEGKLERLLHFWDQTAIAGTCLGSILSRSMGFICETYEARNLYSWKHEGDYFVSQTTREDLKEEREKRGMKGHHGPWWEIPLVTDGNNLYCGFHPDERRIVYEWTWDDVDGRTVRQADYHLIWMEDAMAIEDQIIFDWATVTPDPDLWVSLQKHIVSNEVKFIFGERSLDEWDDYVEELMTRLKGQEIVESALEQSQAAGDSVTGIHEDMPMQ